MRSRSFDRADLRDNTLTVAELAQDTRDKAARTVARHSPDAEDLPELLTMLGLIGQPEQRPLTPSARRKATPEGVEVRRAWQRRKAAQRREESP